MSKLTAEEKSEIQNLLADGVEAKDIAKQLNRAPKTIEKYQEEFEQLAKKLLSRNEIVHELSPQEANNTVVNNSEIVELLDDIKVATIHKLKLQGIKEDLAKGILNYVESQLPERIDDPARLTALCLQKMAAYNSMITKTGSGNSGVAIMTGAASQIIDEQKKNYKRSNGRDCLYSSKTGEKIR